MQMLLVRRDGAHFPAYAFEQAVEWWNKPLGTCDATVML